MHVGTIVRALVGIALLCAGFAIAAGIDQPALSGNSAFLLSAQQLKQQEDLARNGNCDAALKVSHYYSFGQHKLAKALLWLRLAARCPNANAKAELVYMLLQQPRQVDVANEIDRLVAELKPIDAAQALAVEQEVNRSRAAAH